jgi:uncharacterized repeat protein (TIGR01451 family)
VPGTYAVSYTATVDANATGTVSNAVVPTGGSTTPPTCSTCSTTHPLAANVTVTKALTGESGTQAGVAEPNETLTYTITLTNSGGVDATNVGISDRIDTNTTFVSASNGGAFGAGFVTWNGLTVPAGGTLTLTVAVKVVATIPAGVAQVANLAYQTGTTPPACPPGGPQCVVTPTAANVAVTKALTSESGTQTGIAEPGEALTYTITVNNTGGTAATNAGVTDRVDTNTTFVSASNGGTFAAGLVTWTNLTVPAGGSLTLAVQVQVASSLPAGTTQVANLAYQTGTTPPACPPGGPQCVVTPTVANVSVTKALTAESGNQPGVAEPGEALTYTVTLSNDGGSAATSVGITDRIDTNTTFVSASNGGAFAAGLVTWANLTVPAGGTLTLTVQVQVANPLPTGTIQVANLAYLTGTTPPACPPSGPQCVVTPTAANVSIVKTLTGETGSQAGVAESGETLTYSIILSNSGGSAATNVGITDRIDANTTFVSASNGGAFATGLVSWTNLTVPAGGALTLSVQVQVIDPLPAGVTQVANVAYQTGTTPPACPPSGPQCVVTPTTSNVTATKALSGESIVADGIAEPGEELTYTITVRNDGGTPATGTIVDETVPLHTTFVSGAPTWTCAAGSPGGTACTTLVNVPAHDGTQPGVVTLIFTVKVDDPLPVGVVSIANAVAVNGGTPPDCASMPTDPACVVVPTVNLRLTKTVASMIATGPSTYRIAYQIEVVNLGGAPATYTLTDTLGFTLNGVVFTGNAQVATNGGALNPALPGGQFPPANGTIEQLSASNVSLGAGATHIYTVTVPIGVQPAALQDGACTGAPGHGLYNDAAVSGTFTLDSAACVPVSPDAALIRLVKTVTLAQDVNGNHYGDAGDALGYHFTISNAGTLPLTAVQLFDPRVQSLQCSPITADGVPFRVLPGDELLHGIFDAPMGGALAPGDSIDCTAGYALTADDVARRRVVNSATATGTGPMGQTVSSVGTAIFTAFR